jgi:hypothetical protein
MALADQIAYAQSMMEHLCALLIKLDKPPDSFEEPGIHAFLFKMRVTRELHDDWDSYTKHDLMRVIARLKRIHAEYEKQLDKRREEKRSTWAELRENESRIIRDCLTRDQAIEWMQQYARHSTLVEYFEFGGIVNKVQYWKKREKFIRLYRFTEALATFRQLQVQPGFEQYEFEQLFEERKEVAWPEILYRPLFTTGTSQQTTREQ